jgi:hypothetical protein
MKVSELNRFLREHRGIVPDDAEVVSQMPDPEGWKDDMIVKYASAGVEYDPKKNELIINIT